jgi:hypothetical protein
MFTVRRRPASIPLDRTIINVGVHGKRGSAEQIAPSLTYDFVPNRSVPCSCVRLSRLTRAQRDTERRRLRALPMDGL